MRTRISLILVFFLLLSCHVFAQWSVGVTGGATLSFRQWNLIDLVDISYDPGLSYNAALAGEWRAGRLISFRAEGGYQVWRSRTKAEVTDENGGSLGEFTINDDLEALSGALLAKITPFNRLNLYFLTGPSVARIVKNKAMIKGKLPDGVEIPRSQSFDLKESGIEPNQYFVSLGIGNAFNFGSKGQITAEARYQIGLSNLSTASTVDARISTLLVNLGYLYRLGS